MAVRNLSKYNTTSIACRQPTKVCFVFLSRKFVYFLLIRALRLRYVVTISAALERETSPKGNVLEYGKRTSLGHS